MKPTDKQRALLQSENKLRMVGSYLRPKSLLRAIDLLITTVLKAGEQDTKEVK